MVTCRLLGPIEVWFDDKRIDLGYPRQRTLLAILLIDANRLVTVDSLIDRTWGDHPPATARDTLYGDMSKLRRALTPAPDLRLLRQPGGYLINTQPETIDLHRFRQLVITAHRTADDEATAALLDEALALWHGEPFADLDNTWLTTLRTSLNDEKHTATLDRNDAQLRLGRHTHLLTHLATAAADHPLDERLAAQYMLALHRGNRPAEALRHYQHTRRRLADELDADPGPELQELHNEILRNDTRPHTTTPPPTPAPAPARPLTPRQLPAYAPHFVGRTRELRRLTEVLDSAGDTGGTVVISAIAGAGGIGKTWLALRWAHENTDRFPDGQLFVDLRGFTPNGDPMTPRTAVRGFLDGLRVDPDRIPADLDAQTALYRSLVADKRMLIVLDNAADTTQVTPLLPGGPTCTVIVTSRRRLTGLITGHHAHHVPLDVLTDTEARHLLCVRLGAERVAAEPDAVDTLLACCAGFPLALGIVVGRALAYPDFPLSVLAAELADTTAALGALDEGDAATSLPAVLSWSVRALTTEQARVFALVGIAPSQDIGLPATAALTALSTKQARAVLRELENASLVQQHTPGRYRMHDLIRRYAADQADRELCAEARTAASRRLVDFYLRTAHAGDRLLYPQRDPIDIGPSAGGTPLASSDAKEALHWFDVEYPCLVAAQQLAATHGWDTAVWQLAWTLDTFHYRRHLHDRVACWRAGLAAVQRLGDSANQVRAHRHLGDAYARTGNYGEGLHHLTRALELAEKTDDQRAQAHTHFNLSWAWNEQGDGRQALVHITAALRLFQALGDPVGEADALNAAGWVAAHLGLHEQAQDACERALTLARHHHHDEIEANALDSLGYIAHHNGRHTRAIAYYHQALDLFRELRDAYNEADTLANLGHAHAACAQHAEARAAWHEALALYRRQSRTANAERLERELAELAEKSGIS